MKTKITGKNKIKGKLKLRTSEEEQERLEKELIEQVIEARINANLRQDDLSALTGITQPVISRMEGGVHSPHISTLIKVLYTMGYTLEVAPLNKVKKK